MTVDGITLDELRDVASKDLILASYWNGKITGYLASTEDPSDKQFRIIMAIFRMNIEIRRHQGIIETLMGQGESNE